MRARLLAASVIGCCGVVCLYLALPITGSAQAWLPLKGEGQFTYTYQNVRVRDHLNYLGNRFDAGPIRTHSQVFSFEYGLSKKLALDFDITHVTSKYEGFVSTPPHGPVDTGEYHPTFQDLHIGARYNVYNRAVTLTPFVSVVIPTHHYETKGHSAVGRDLNELQMGISAGRDLEGFIPRSYVQGRYSYAIVEDVQEFSLNRSNADWEFGHLATDRLSLRFTGVWQWTADGIDIPNIHNHPDFHELHDRASRSHFVRFGGGATFSVNRSLDLHADYNGTMAGINTHAAKGLSLGLTWRFSRGFKLGG